MEELEKPEDDKRLVIDIRPKEQFVRGTFPGAVNIPMGDFEEKRSGLHFIQCACRFTENCVSCGGGRGSKRDEMKELIAQFRKTSDVIDVNIFNSVKDINLRKVIGYHRDGERYQFLDDYMRK